MKLSNVLFLPALLFFAFATVSLVAGIPVPGNTVTKIQKPVDSAPTKYIPIINDIEYLGEGPSWGWRRLRAPGPDALYALELLFERPRGLDTHLQFKFAWATHHGRVESAKYDVSDVSVPVHGDVKVSPAVPSNPFDVICGTWERQVEGERPMVIDIKIENGELYESRKYKDF